MHSNRSIFRSSALRTLLAGAGLGACLALSASPAMGQVRCDLNGVAGVPAGTQGTDSLLCSNFSTSVGPSDDLTAIGQGIGFAGDSITLVGAHTMVSTGVIGDVGIPYSPPAIDGSTAIGAYSAVAGTGNVAIGDQALVGEFTIGGGSITVDAYVNLGTAVGSHASVTAAGGTALGAESDADGIGSTAIGRSANASGDSSFAGGFFTVALGESAIAIGGWIDVDGDNTVDAAERTVALGIESSAFGGAAQAIGDGSVAVGARSTAVGANTTALGWGATATADNAVAIGAGSVADEANTVSVGAVGAERQIVHVAAGDVTATSTDAVNGSQLFATNLNVAANSAAIAALDATVDTHTTQIADLQVSSGDQAAAIDTLETTTATHTTQIATHTSQITAIEAVNATQSSQISALEAAQSSMAADIDTLFDLRSSDRRDMKQGVAAAMSMASAPMPSEPGRISYAVNGATFRGEYAVGGSLMYRLPTRAPMAVNVGFSYAGNKNNGVRVGVAGEF